MVLDIRELRNGGFICNAFASLLRCVCTNFEQSYKFLDDNQRHQQNVKIIGNARGQTYNILQNRKNLVKTTLLRALYNAAVCVMEKMTPIITKAIDYDLSS